MLPASRSLSVPDFLFLLRGLGRAGAPHRGGQLHCTAEFRPCEPAVPRMSIDVRHRVAI
jgi:hypothetical protein